MMFAIVTTAVNKENEMAFRRGSPVEETYFTVNLIISMLTATFGICKYLLNGPCRLIPSNGYLNGIISCKFLLACLAVLFTLSVKVILSAVLFLFVNYVYSS